MRHQADGTQPPDPAAVRTISEEDRRFLEAAMQEYAQEPVKRMQEIEKQLHEQAPGEEAVARQESLLEELAELTENIDFARDLAMIGGLPTLLKLLQSPHPGLRARAAEVLATCAQANPPVQVSPRPGISSGHVSMYVLLGCVGLRSAQ
jgi:hsp70-interacting protein